MEEDTVVEFLGAAHEIYEEMARVILNETFAKHYMLSLLDAQAKILDAILAVRRLDR